MDISAKIQEEKFPLCKPLPGVEKLITHLHAHNIPIAVATSSMRSKFDIKTTSCRDMFKLFDYIVCGDDADIKKGKPAPDIFLAAQNRLGNPPAENCLVFEDAINGIEAGLAANMHVSVRKWRCDGMHRGVNDVDVNVGGMDPRYQPARVEWQGKDSWRM